MLALSAVTTAILFAWLLYYTSYGLSLNDEGFYLNSIANPFAYAINMPPSLFGFVYHWPYKWAGGDIAVLRMANVTLTMALGWILSFLVIRRLWTVAWPYAAVLSAGIASMALLAFFTRLRLTPNYHTLNIQSISMVMIGLLLADRPGRLRQVLGGILVGVGGWGCFMARPTTAAAIALIVILYVVFLRRKSLLPMLGAALVALALLIVTAYLIDGGITGLVSRMVNTAETEILLGSGHEVSRMFRIDRLPTSRSGIAIAVLVATALLLSMFIGATHKLLQSLSLAAVLIVTIAIAVLGIDPISIKPRADLLFLVPTLTCLGATFYHQGLVLRTQTPRSIALALIFLVLPHLQALGSNVNYWGIAGFAALFWMLAVVAFLSPLAQQERSLVTLVPLMVFAQLLTASVVNAGLLKPHGQVKDLRSYTAIMTMRGGGKLVLSQSFRDYLAPAIAQARAAGLDSGAPMVNLAGLGASLLYVLETRALGLPWLFGGYRGSSAVAVSTLGLEDCADLAKAWILIEPDGPLHLEQASVLASFGAGQSDYVVAATFERPFIDLELSWVVAATWDPRIFEGDYPKPVRQFLLKPVRPAALAEQSCRDARRQRSDFQK
ncbi:hypothetical protein [Bradyrhizobium sp. ISRA464]|uniref:hypothetical protein n=2 Tax=unclassified Bradyrhizobium TaxID=2631580 RepID=UPI00247865D1|nr:hypothetical protein [Bradyrhizobium sp. ISRA464]WGS25995.1 hypothetical protein MTX19_30115 [Bradyrhizobium sp. ISRA464]